MRFDPTSATLARYRLPWTYIFELPLTSIGLQARDEFMQRAYAEAGAQDQISAHAATDAAYRTLLRLESWNFRRDMFPLAADEELKGVCLGEADGEFPDWLSAVMHRHDDSDDWVDRDMKRHMVLLRAWRLLDVHTAVHWTLNKAGHADEVNSTYHFGPRGT